MADDPDRKTFIIVVIGAGLATIIALFAMWVAVERAFGADNNPPCLSKQAARAKYPGAWLYWHGQDHCWDNQPGHMKPSLHRPMPKTITHPDSKPNIEPDGSIVPKKSPGETVAYPTLMAGGGTIDTMLQPDAMTRWPLMMDFDEPPPQFKTWNDRIQFEEKK